jgi:pimeloyl-ACP methyl ester carboxylesterase
MNANSGSPSLTRRIGGMPEGRSIRVGDIDTTYYEAGRGEPIVFIYGGNFGSGESAPSAPCWDLNFVPLSKSYRVIALDKLGQGYTDAPKRGEDFTMAAVVRHAADFIQALKLPPVHLVGHSRGGFAATRLALEYQHLVRSVTIVNSGTLSTSVSTNELVLSRAPYPPFTRESARWIYEGYCFDPKSVTEEWIDVVYDVMATPAYRATVKRFAEEQLGSRIFIPQLSLQKRETLHWLAEGRLQRPTQIIWGYNDRTAAVAGAYEMFDMIGAHQRKTALHVINEAGHFPYREHPERFNALLAGFVDFSIS